MKVNIKGLVFVGFAAAILSANAMAEGENIVTSKSYVDAKVVNNLESSATDKAPSQGAVNTALANKQDKDNGSTYMVSIGGTWDTISNAFESGTYTNKLSGADGVLTIDVNANTDGTLANVNTTGEAGQNDNLLPTSRAVKAYVDSGIAAVNSARTYNADSTTISLDTNTNTFSATLGAVDSNNSGLVTGATVKSYVDAKVVDNVTDTSTDIAPSVGAVNSALATKENVSNKINTIDSNSDSAHYPSAEAVYDYVQSMTGGTVIPTMNTSVCDSTHPCALVNDSTGLHWRTMATATDTGGACGDVGGCTGNVEP